MKNRRSTILVAIMVTLVGTPKVWQEFGNLFSALQHKTQNRLLSMGLSAQVQENSEKEVSGVVRPENIASCPAATFKQISDRSSEGTSSTKIKAQRRARVRSEEPLTLTARVRTDSIRKETLPSSEHALAQAAQNQLDIRGLPSAFAEEIADKSNVTEVVSLPQLNMIAPIFIERGADFLKLKKALEENKLPRQKIRCIIRTTPAIRTT
ncbi:MAG TPA: hypothetical protein VKB86_13450 [Pyrinomonadaceae bacterium]|nr:hypothetical protein [Pyrinomonadaceae bacterium]